MEVRSKIAEKIKDKATDPNFIQELFRSYPPFAVPVRVADEVIDRVG